MKILKGSYKGVDLAVPLGTDQVRPTVDHVKKNIFSLLDTFKPKVVWDLFAGTGGVGLEFLSRGSSAAVFVEQSRKATDCLNLNLAECRLKDADTFARQLHEVILSPVSAFLKNPKLKKVTTQPNLIFLDPPYGSAEVKKPIPLILACPLYQASCLVLIEHVLEDLQLPWTGTQTLFHEVYGPKA